MDGPRPLESIDECFAVDLESNPTPGHVLAEECPLPGEDWGEDLKLVPGASQEWTELTALGIAQSDTVDLSTYASLLGVNQAGMKAVAVTYATNRTSSPIDVDVCWSSTSAAQVWLNDRVVGKVSFSGSTLCDCAGRRPGTLVPGANKIAVALWQTCWSWDFRLRLLRSDGQAIDDGADSEVEFSAYPDGDCPPSSPFQATRSIESVNACPALPGGSTITIRGNGEGDPGQILTLTEAIHGQAIPSAVSGGGVITSLEGPSACHLEPKAPVGLFTDHRDIGSPCGPGSIVVNGTGAYEVKGGGQDQFSCGDSFQFAFLSLSGDFSITAHIAERDWGSPVPSGRWGKFGLMARQTCSQKSRFAFIHDNSPNQSPPFPGGTEADPDGIAFDGRPIHEGDDLSVADGQAISGLKHPDHLRLERSGNTFRGFASADGKDWRTIGEMDWGPGAPCEVLAGLAVLSNTDCGLIRIGFDQVTVSGGDQPCPPPGAGGARITWRLRRSDLNAGVSFTLAGSGAVQLSGNDGLHATEGANQVLLEANNPVGPEFEDSRAIGRPFRGAGSTAYEEQDGVYTQTGSGYDLWDQGDGFQFAYRRVRGDFELAVEIVERDFPTNPGSEWGQFGLLASRSCLSNSRHTFVEENVGSIVDSPRLQTRAVDAIDRGDTEEFFGYPDPDPETAQLPDFLKLVRHGSTFYGFLSRDGVKWDSIGADTWYGQDPENPILAGFLTMRHTTMDGAPVVKFRVLQFGPLDPALPPPFRDDGLASGTETYRTAFDDQADLQVQHRDGTFDPRIQGGRLRLQDQTKFGSSVSAFRKTPIEDIDSAIYQFDFDAFISRDQGEPSADGFTFTLNGDRDVTRVGGAGGWMGYQGLGGGVQFGDQIVADQNVSKNSFSVEFDTWQGNFTNEGTGSPAHPRTWHLGINTANTVNSVVETSEDLPDIFDPQGIHARVRYNRGRVTVSLAPRAGSTEGLQQFLEADLIPISFLAPDESAVFGFTAATGGAAETGEVDNLVVTRFAPVAAANWLRCDSNGDGERDISDPIFLLQSLFGGGAAAECPVAADCNSDGETDISDAVFDLDFQFLGGPSPAAPYPACDAFPACPDGCR